MRLDKDERLKGLFDPKSPVWVSDEQDVAALSSVIVTQKLGRETSERLIRLVMRLTCKVEQLQSQLDDFIEKGW